MRPSAGVLVAPFAIGAAVVWAGIGVALGVMNTRRRREIEADRVKAAEA